MAMVEVGVGWSAWRRKPPWNWKAEEGLKKLSVEGIGGIWEGSTLHHLGAPLCALLTSCHSKALLPGSLEESEFAPSPS